MSQNSWHMEAAPTTKLCACLPDKSQNAHIHSELQNFKTLGAQILIRENQDDRTLSDHPKISCLDSEGKSAIVC